MTVYYFKEDVRNVTEYYYKVILDALKDNGNTIRGIETHKDKAVRCIPKDSYILVTSLFSFIRLYIKGFRNYIYWFQGISPEEDYLIRKSRLRELVLSKIEKLALSKVKYKIGVSKYLFEHYNSKYKLDIKINDCFIMPCFNSDYYKGNFFIPNKYDNNVFCYAGGLQPWQGFESILKTYSDIESKYKNTFLKVFSKDLEGAKKLIEKYNISNYSVDCVKQEDMNKALAQCKYGFIIRDNDIINQVATPTKLVTYIGNGVIPIFTSTIRFYADLAKEYEHLYCYDETNKEVIIDMALSVKINPILLEEEYRNIINKYFDAEVYRKKLSEYLKEM